MMMRNELFKWNIENKKETLSSTEYISLDSIKAVNMEKKFVDLSYVNYNLVEKHHEVRRLR